MRLDTPEGVPPIAVNDAPDSDVERHTNDSVRWGTEMAAFVTSYFRTKFGARSDNVMKIVFEKTFFPWLSYGKKRYVGWKYGGDVGPSPRPLTRSL